MLTLSMHSDMDTLCDLFGGCGPVDDVGNFEATVRPTTLAASLPPPPSAPNRIKDHCSVIIKLVANATGTLAAVDGSTNSSSTGASSSTSAVPWAELFTAHTTWSGLEDMTRVYKMYSFPFTLSGRGESSMRTNDNGDREGSNGSNATDTVVPGHSIAFSSYPGNLFSTDDWYTLSSGLVRFLVFLSPTPKKDSVKIAAAAPLWLICGIDGSACARACVHTRGVRGVCLVYTSSASLACFITHF